MSLALKKDMSLWQYYASLEPSNGAVMLTYIWVDATGIDMRSKTKIIDYEPTTPEECPWWTFDGIPLGMTGWVDSDLYLQPVALFRDPFRRGPHKLVLCQTFDTDRTTPLPTSKRVSCLATMEQVAEEEPWFGVEQEYWLLGSDGVPLGWTQNVCRPSNCGVGSDVVFRREIAEAHAFACVYAGIKICGLNVECVIGQWEYQIGPCAGAEIGDHSWMARYILQRVTEDFGVRASFDYMHSPNAGDFTGSTAHMNFSTARMRKKGGLKYIYEGIKKLGSQPMDTTAYLPEGPCKKRKHEDTGDGYRWRSTQVFTNGIADRTTSTRIPRKVADDGMGYFEDRRAAANSDPYAVAEHIAKVCLCS